MKRMHWLFALAALVSTPASAALQVFACEPEWGALLQELAGERAAVRVATTAAQDPHRIQARPSLIAAVRRAELVVCTGAGLEAGWLPLLLRSAGNPKVLPGAKGYFEAAAHVQLRDVPAALDRAQGDVHPAGNPHIHTDPRNILSVANALAGTLAAVDPAHARDYEKRHGDFQRRWRQAMAQWETRGASLRDMAIVSQHKSWSYLIQWLGLREVAVLEPRPGLPPGGGHLSAVATQMAQQPAKAVIRAAYQDPQPSQWLQQQTGISAVTLPYTIGGSPAATDLFGLFDDTLDRLLEVAGE